MKRGILINLVLILINIVFIYGSLPFNNQNAIYRSSSLIYEDALFQFRTYQTLNGLKNCTETLYTFYNTLKTTNLTTLEPYFYETKTKLPDGMVPFLFTGSHLNLAPMIAYLQIDKDNLLQNKPFVPNFYEFDYENGSWQSEQKLSLNSPIRRSGASLIVVENEIKKKNKNKGKEKETEKEEKNGILKENEVDEGLLVFGGVIRDPATNALVITKQLYFFDTKLQLWTDLSNVRSANLISPSAFHTATKVDNKIIVLGGARPALITTKLEDKVKGKEKDNMDFQLDINLQLKFQSDLEYVYIYDIQQKIWNVQRTLTFSNKPRLGHTATYLPKLKAIFIYGGTAGLNPLDKVYNDLQILNLETWEWTQPILLPFNEDNNFIEEGRAWHSAQLLDDKLIIFDGDVRNNNNNNKIQNILILDLNEQKGINSSYKFSDAFGNNLNYNNKDSLSLKKASLAMASKESNDEKNSLTNTPWTASPLIMGITFGLFGGIIIAFLIFFLLWKFKFSKYKEVKANLESRESLLSSNHSKESLLPRFTDPATILNPFKNSNIDTSNPVWDLDSNYAYSTRDTIIIKGENNWNTLIQTYPNNKKLWKSWLQLNNSDIKKNNDYSESNNTLIVTRRWSNEFGDSPKVLNEVTPMGYFKGNTTLVNQLYSTLLQTHLKKTSTED